MQILNSLVPIFSVILLGVILRRRNFLNHETTQAFNRFAYFVALPVFLFYKIGTAPTGDGLANRYMITLLGATLVTVCLSCVVIHVCKIDWNSRGTLIQAGFRGNLAFIGLPLVIFTTHDFPEAEQLKLESAVLIALPPVVIFYNIASVTALSIYSTSTEQLLSWRKVLFNISTNPLLIACLAGLVVQRTGLGIPTALSRTCEVIGASAFSIALIGIGSQLASISVAGKWTESLTSSVIKNVACPIAGWIIGVSIGLSGTELLVILIMCATPTAVSSFILADQIGGDANQAASTVVVGTACSFATLSVLLMLPF
jgi:hypothetical protein